jgi:hypothetical protein
MEGLFRVPSFGERYILRVEKLCWLFRLNWPGAERQHFIRFHFGSAF